MHVITRKRLNDFAAHHPQSRSSLAHWYRLMKTNDFTSLTDLRGTFPTADLVGSLTVFTIGGNKFRLIAAVHYNRRKIFIRAVLTHNEYDLGQWKK